MKAIFVSPDSADHTDVLCEVHEACNSCKDIHFEHFYTTQLDITLYADQLQNCHIAIFDLSVKNDNLYYHLGVRESMGRIENIIIYNEETSNGSLLKKQYNCERYVGYSIERRNNDHVQCVYVQHTSEHVGVTTNPPLPTMATASVANKDCTSPCRSWPCLRLKSRLQMLISRTTVLTSFSANRFLTELKKAKDRFKGQHLVEAINCLRRQLFDKFLLSTETIVQLMLAYRDADKHDAVIELYEQVAQMPSSGATITENAAVTQLYASSLNRRNGPGDRDNALHVMLHLVDGSALFRVDLHCDSAQAEVGNAPDLLCLVGRIYKDKFIESDGIDRLSLQESIKWYQKGFNVIENIYAGINLCTMLVIAGHNIGLSDELNCLSPLMNRLIGRKGPLDSLTDYWDIASYFELCALTENYTAANQAAMRMYRMEPHIWQISSTHQNLLILFRFREDLYKKIAARADAHQNIFLFWLDMFESISRQHAPETHCPCLLYEWNGQYAFAYFQLNLHDAEPSIHIKPLLVALCLGVFEQRKAEFYESFVFSEYATDERKALTTGANSYLELSFTMLELQTLSPYHRDGRGLMFYFADCKQNFLILFPLEEIRVRIQELISKRWRALQADQQCESRELLQDAVGAEAQTVGVRYEYEFGDRGERRRLGRGRFGAVYAAVDLDRQVRIAVKELSDLSADQMQRLHPEIQLYSTLSHPNIVKYLGSCSDGGILKIFMECVPGGSLRQLLKDKWGPLMHNEPTIVFYTKQIVQGIHYLHAQGIVHRDIKSDNVLIDDYHGIVKISDFGTSERLVGVNTVLRSVAGTLRYMAPEVVALSERGYGAPADIWSLGCTVWEMAVGHPPYINLDECSAIFKIGNKCHPDIPAELSAVAKQFMLRCFEADPDRRATAAQLLEDLFVTKRQLVSRAASAFGRSDRNATPGTPPYQFDARAPANQ